MAISKRAPNTIFLGGGLPGGEGGYTVLNEYIAAESITPGHIIELYNNGGVLMWRKHASATEITMPFIAVDKIEWNKGVDDAYVSGELVNAYLLKNGSMWWALIPSGQNIQPGELLQSNGNGELKSATDTSAGANLGQFQALESLGAITVSTRCRVQVIQ